MSSEPKQPRKGRAKQPKPAHMQRSAAVQTTDLAVSFFELDQAICMVSTASRAMDAIREDEGMAESNALAEPALVLSHGVKALREAYNSLDIAARTLLKPQG